MNPLATLKEYLELNTPLQPEKPVMILKGELPKQLEQDIYNYYVNNHSEFVNTCNGYQWILKFVSDSEPTKAWMISVENNRFFYTVHADSTIFTGIAKTMVKMEENNNSFKGKINNKLIILISKWFEFKDKYLKNNSN